MRRVPIFLIVFSEVALRAAKSVKRKRFNLFLEQDTTPPPPTFLILIINLIYWMFTGWG
jgi:hypothetical protein